MARNIFAYHAVADGFEPSATTITERRFRSQCEVLAQDGWRAVRLDEMRATVADDSFCLTVDDAYCCLLEVIVAVCAKHGWRGTAFVPTDLVGGDGSWDVGAWRKHRHLDWNGLREVAAAGWELGVHGKSHRALTEMPLADAMDELADSRKIIEDMIGAPVTSLAYPFGAASRSLAEGAAGMGFHRGVTMMPGAVDADSHPLLLPRWPVYRMDSAAHLRARLYGAGWLQGLEKAKTRTIQGFALGTRVRMMGAGNTVPRGAME